MKINLNIKRGRRKKKEIISWRIKIKNSKRERRKKTRKNKSSQAKQRKEK